VVPELRRAWNAAFSEERYRAMVSWLEAEAGVPIPFRISETPLFLSRELTAELERAALEVLPTLTAPEYLAAARRAVPPRWEVPGEDEHTVFLQVDFALASRAGSGGAAGGAALAAADGDLTPRLIELQGFPSLYGFQWLLARAYREHFDVPAGLTPYFGGLDDAGYIEALRRTIVGSADPENVVLLEIEPEKQKTRVDFEVTERLLGVRAVSAAEVIVRGDRVYYRDASRGGREVPIERIYNRVIFDEVERRGLDFGPLFREPLAVEWVGHPNWFWKISKFSLPFLRGPHCTECHFLTSLPPPSRGCAMLVKISAWTTSTSQPHFWHHARVECCLRMITSRSVSIVISVRLRGVMFFRLLFSLLRFGFALEARSRLGRSLDHHLRGCQERSNQTGSILVVPENRAVIIDGGQYGLNLAWDRDSREDASAQRKSLRALKG